MILEAPFGVLVTINDLPGSKLIRPFEPVFSWEPSLSWEQKERQDLLVILTELWVQRQKAKKTMDLSILIHGLSPGLVVKTIKFLVPLTETSKKIHTWNGVRELFKEAVEKNKSMAFINMSKAAYVDAFLFLRCPKKGWVLVLFQSKQKSTLASRRKTDVELARHQKLQYEESETKKRQKTSKTTTNKKQKLSSKKRSRKEKVFSPILPKVVAHCTFRNRILTPKSLTSKMRLRVTTKATKNLVLIGRSVCWMSHCSSILLNESIRL